MKNDITLMLDKIHFSRRSTVFFSEYVLDREEYLLNQDLVRNITEFTMPTHLHCLMYAHCLIG